LTYGLRETALSKSWDAVVDSCVRRNKADPAIGTMIRLARIRNDALTLVNDVVEQSSATLKGDVAAMNAALLAAGLEVVSTAEKAFLEHTQAWAHRDDKQWKLPEGGQKQWTANVRQASLLAADMAVALYGDDASYGSQILQRLIHGMDAGNLDVLSRIPFADLPPVNAVLSKEIVRGLDDDDIVLDVETSLDIDPEKVRKIEGGTRELLVGVHRGEVETIVAPSAWRTMDVFNLRFGSRVGATAIGPVVLSAEAGKRGKSALRGFISIGTFDPVGFSKNRRLLVLDPQQDQHYLETVERCREQARKSSVSVRAGLQVTDVSVTVLMASRGDQSDYFLAPADWRTASEGKAMPAQILQGPGYEVFTEIAGALPVTPTTVPDLVELGTFQLVRDGDDNSYVLLSGALSRRLRRVVEANCLPPAGLSNSGDAPLHTGRGEGVKRVVAITPVAQRRRRRPPEVAVEVLTARNREGAPEILLYPQKDRVTRFLVAERTPTDDGTQLLTFSGTYRNFTRSRWEAGVSHGLFNMVCDEKGMRHVRLTPELDASLTAVDQRVGATGTEARISGGLPDTTGMVVNF
jgi:hypothetical protein